MFIVDFGRLNDGSDLALGQSLTIAMARREQKSETSKDALENNAQPCRPGSEAKARQTWCTTRTVISLLRKDLLYALPDTT